MSVVMSGLNEPRRLVPDPIRIFRRPVNSVPAAPQDYRIQRTRVNTCYNVSLSVPGTVYPTSVLQFQFMGAELLA